jgi:hypothetical protein
MDACLPVNVCGRTFTWSDVKTIRELTEEKPSLNRAEIARQTCALLNWRRPDGRLKDMSCRVALLRLQKRDLIQLPPPRNGNGNGRPYDAAHTIPEPAVPRECSLDDLDGIAIRPVSNRRDSKLWNEAIHRFHYLGFQPLSGAQIRYLIEYEGGLLGALGFGSSAWKVKARDRWIGWTPAQRVAGLLRVVDNARFLILPWIRCANLASWTLSRCARRLPADWEDRYGYRPVLLETFVERDRFRGSCYRAANWHSVGLTQGRGKLDRHHEYALPVKEVFLYPLQRDFREVLCS